MKKVVVLNEKEIMILKNEIKIRIEEIVDEQLIFEKPHWYQRSKDVLKNILKKLEE